MAVEFSAADLALFRDLERACSSLGVSPCLVGAGAIRLEADRRWSARIDRRTLDWDFAIRIGSWTEFDQLAGLLTEPQGGFQAGSSAHQFRHSKGGRLDVIPYGEIELPPGSLQWPDGGVMNLRGFPTLDIERIEIVPAGIRLSVASTPALVGLKLLAYADRRPSVLRDIQDVYSMLRSINEMNIEADDVPDCKSRLWREELSIDQAPVYLLGRTMAGAFDQRSQQAMLAILDRAPEPEENMVRNIREVTQGSQSDRQAILRCLGALALGLRDGPRVSS